ncbi:MAG: cyclic nucleotide-binding domain-containing protein [Magnetococcales bacterium]|nr:cyclic nucleotide-binding domain-containing protein [Magnetococcales bacterium]
MDVKSLIDRIPFFDVLTPNEKLQLAGLSNLFARFRRGDLLMKQGEAGNSFMILVNGTTAAVRAEQPKTVLHVFQPGNVFGEMSFLSRQPRSTHIVAAEDGVIAMQLDDATLQRLGPNIREKIKDHLIQLLVARVNRANEKLLSLSGKAPSSDNEF